MDDEVKIRVGDNDERVIDVSALNPKFKKIS